MNNKNLAFVLFVILIVFLLGFCVWYKISTKDVLSVVYLTTGEVYVGKLSYPQMTLTDAYILQIGKDESGQNNFQLAPLSEALLAAARASIKQRPDCFLRSDGRNE
jgi:hypothetical protein